MKYALLVILLSFSFAVQAQDSVVDTPKIYKFVEQMPKAKYSMNEYLDANLHYPESARKQNVQGKVIVKFVITETGAIGNCVVVKSVSPDIDSEALRVVKNMPPWSPGLSDGKPVNVYFNLPINFKLSNNAPK